MSIAVFFFCSTLLWLLCTNLLLHFYDFATEKYEHMPQRDHLKESLGTQTRMLSLMTLLVNEGTLCSAILPLKLCWITFLVGKLDTIEPDIPSVVDTFTPVFKTFVICTEENWTFISLSLVRIYSFGCIII